MSEDEKCFIQLAKEKNVELIMFNLLEEFKENEIEDKIRRCDIIYNNSAETFAIEFIKTAEALGKRVIEPSKNYYYCEDKWIFFLKCKEHKIPVPETRLLSENINLARKELKDIDKWPVILKRTEGTMGEFVEKAWNLKEALFFIKKFWKNRNEKLPIVVQEFVPSYCYRVLTLGDDVIQTSIKKGHGWKCTGVYEKRNSRFKVDYELEEILKKIRNVFGMKICGVDLVKKDDHWLVLEINSSPAFDFIKSERGLIINKVLDFLIEESKV
ncbi:MAG: ATP-grasp domain-containing protein [archaeon]